MNLKFLNHILLLLLIIICLLGCSKKTEENNNCFSFAKSAVSKVDGPVTAFVNQEVLLTVYFNCYNGSGQFGNYEESIAGNVTTITVNAKYDNCIICTQSPINQQAFYKFKKSQAGIYDLKYLQSDNTYLIHTIVVQ